MEEINGNRYQTVGEVAAAKGLSVYAVYKAIREGKLGVFRVAGRVLVPVEDAAAWTPTTHGGRRPGQGRPRKVREVPAADA